MFDKILKTILLLSPLLYVPGEVLGKCDLIAFPIFVIALFAGSLYTRQQRIVDLKPLALILILGAVNLFLNQYNGIVLYSFITLSLGVIAIYLITTYCEDPHSCFKWMVCAGLINLAILGGQYLGFEPIAVNIAESGGILGNGPRLGIYLALTLPFAFSISPFLAILYIGVCVLIGEVVILPIAMIMFILTAGLDCNEYGGKFNYGLLALFIALTVAGLFFFYDDIIQSFAIRWDIWGPTIEQIFASPVRGHGLGTFPHVSSQFYESAYQADNAFSSYLDFTFGMGLGGLALIIYYYRVTMSRCSFLKDHMIESFAVLSLGIMCFFEYPFEVPKMWPTICAVISFLLIADHKEIGG